jgi:hypothetical protein
MRTTSVVSPKAAADLSGNAALDLLANLFPRLGDANA